MMLAGDHAGIACDGRLSNVPVFLDPWLHVQLHLIRNVVTQKS
jgi:hypothetical protein